MGLDKRKNQMIQDRIPLTDVPSAIREQVKDTSAAPTYRRIYVAILNGSIPAERLNGRWHVSTNLKPIMKHFGLAEKASA
jgi:hypothetical protein